MNANQFPEVYQSLGIDLGKLGCIMLDVEPLVVGDVIDPDDLYISESKGYVKGIVSEEVPHVTLLYGLMRSGPELKSHVDGVMFGWLPSDVTVAQVTAFDSTDPNEPYYCLVAELVLSSNLVEANARLRMLPHIDTFPNYRAHITLAYIKKDETKREKYLAELGERFTLKTVRVVGLNYGD